PPPPSPPFPYTTLFRSLHVRLDGHRVVPLEQRIQELHQRDGLSRRVPIREVVALQHPRHRGGRRQAKHILDAQRFQPLRVSPERSEEHTSELQSRGHLV